MTSLGPQLGRMAMPNPEVSVVIPSYNHAKFIVEAANSVLGQTLGNIELIIVDDGSLDNSPALLEAMARADARIKLIRQKNAGSHSALNSGVQLATAPWIAILNSDDIWAADRLETMLAAAARDGGNFLFSDVDLIDGDGALIDDSTHWWNIDHARNRLKVVENGVRNGLLYGNFTVSTSNFLFRKEVVSKVGLFRHYRYNLDWDFVLRCIYTEGVTVQFIPRCLLHYRLHGKNAILGGMPLAAVEAQNIIRRVYRDQFGAPETLSLSHYRHDRLLRKYLAGRRKRWEASYAELEVDRDKLSSLLAQRQLQFDVERRASTHRLESLSADLTAMESSRNEAEALLISRQAIIDRERLTNEAELAHNRQLLDRSYRRGVHVALERDVAACRVARLEERFTANPKGSDDRRGRGVRGWCERVKHVFYPGVVPAFNPEDAIFVRGNVREALGTLHYAKDKMPRIAVHMHLYYRDLAGELVDYLMHIPELWRVVVTGPWDMDALESDLAPLYKVCTDVRVVQVPNQGKDVGGLIQAVKQHELLDSDYLLKIHSKKSHNPAAYFEAISAVFGLHLENGDQWRRALIQPLAGSRERVEEILGCFDSDHTVGMVGAGPFVTTAADANVELHRAVCSKFGVPYGEAFVAGTMFWIRSSLLAPLLDDLVEVGDFEIDSRAVEGGLEHVMERIFGAMVVGKGFDLLKVGS